MKDDELMRGLAEALREEETTSPSSKWEALSQGELGPTEIAELEKLAASDPSAAEALELYRPLGAAFEEEVALSFLAAPAAQAAKPSPRAQKSAKIYRLSAFIAAPLAVAAAAALFIGRAHRGGREEMPPYEIALASNVQAQRSEPATATANARLHRHAFFEAVARPSVPPHDAVAARAVLVRNGHATAWHVPIQISNEGAVRIAGPADTIFPETTGSYDIVLALGAPSALPDDAALERLAERGGEASYRVVRAHVSFADE